MKKGMLLIYCIGSSLYLIPATAAPGGPFVELAVSKGDTPSPVSAAHTCRTRGNGPK